MLFCVMMALMVADMYLLFGDDSDMVVVIAAGIPRPSPCSALNMREKQTAL